MDRDAFVAAVIAQLQAEESLELKAERPESALARTCRRLHVFDFPEVAEREIIALTKSITEIEASSELLFQHFRINDKFLENLNYICTHNRTHHVVQFLRSLFLTLPLYFQSCDKSQLQRYFTLEEEDKLADWSSIFRSFAAFCMTMSTSMLAACTADDRSARSSIGDSEIMKLIEFLSSLSVTLARPRKDHAGPPESKATLGGYMRAIGCASPLPDDESSACAIEVNDQPVAVDLYFHVGYLIRDLLLLNPAAIPVCMPALYNALGIVADGSIQALSDAELSMALLVIGSVIDSFNIDDTWRHGGKRAKDGAPAALLGAFLLERVGVFAAICAHFTSVSPVLHAVEQAATDANSSRQKHVFSILTSVGVMLSELDQGPKSELFDRAFVESTLLDLLQTAAFFQLHQNGGLDTR